MSQEKRKTAVSNKPDLSGNIEALKIELLVLRRIIFQKIRRHLREL